jgi:hypothetical protein
MGSDSQDKGRITSSRRKKLLVSIIVTFAIFIFFSTSIDMDSAKLLEVDYHSMINEGKPKFMKFPVFSAYSMDDMTDYSDNPETPLDLSGFYNCSDVYKYHEIVPRPRNNWTTKPLFVSMTPHTISESLHKNLINYLTRLPAGAKSFYVSRKNSLKHCKGDTETATCTTHHPGVPMNRGQPDSFTHFNDQYIYVLRNPMFNFPAVQNSKDFQYRHIVGQTKKQNWIEYRDTYFSQLMKEWKKSLKTWSETRYKLAMYLTYEDLMDINKGPKTLKALAGILKNAGFDVVEEDDAIKCIWFNAVGAEQIQRHHEKHYDYDEYIPGYSISQRDEMLSELESFLNENEKDIELVKIIRRYVNDIREHMKIDLVNGDLSH